MSLPSHRDRSAPEPGTAQPVNPPHTFLERCALIFGSGGLVIVTWAALIVGGFLVVTLIGLFVMLLAEAGVLKWVLLCVAAAGGLGWYIHANHEEPAPQPGPRRERHAGIYGDAAYAPFADVADRGLIPSGEDLARSVYLGEFIDWYTPVDQDWERTGAHVGYAGENNILTIAPAGTGKFISTIVPTLLTNTESMFVLDVKGEAYAVTAAARARMGHRIVVINPFNVFGDMLGLDKPLTAQFNPLAGLDPKANSFTSHIDALSAAQVLQESKEPHFSDRARDLVSCLMSHVSSDPKELAAGNNHLGRVREILGLPPDEFAAYMHDARENPIPRVRNLAGGFSDPESREVASIISTAIRALTFMDHPQIAAFLRGSTFDFADLRREPMTIYCILPPNELNTYFPLARLMLQSALNRLSVEPKPGDRRVLLVLDEQAQLKYMDSLVSAVALLRGYRVRIWSVFQDLAQLQGIYGERWESFVSNAGIVQVFTTNDDKTARYFSAKAGNYTATVISTSTSTSSNQSNSGTGRSTSSGTNHNTNVGQTGVPFLPPQAFYSLPEWQGVLFVRGMRDTVPVYRLPYWEEPMFAGRYLPNPYHDADGFRYQWQLARLETEAEGRPFVPSDEQREAA